MGIPTYVLFDADADKPDRNGSRAKHAIDNTALLTILGKADWDPMPDAVVRESGFTMWHSDITSIVEADIGKDEWTTFRTEADKRYGHAGDLRKNTLHIGASLAFAWDAGKRSANLERVCNDILSVDNTVPT